jgi:hypothetical protein
MRAPRFRCEEDADLCWDDKIDTAKEKAIDMKYKIQVPATAAQRAEAFLRTLGLWEEAK